MTDDRTARACELRARGWVVQPSQRLIFADSEVTDSAGTIVGRGTGTFAVSKLELTPAMGYL